MQFFAAVFLVAVMWLTRRQKGGLWKDSALAFLFHGLDASLLENLGRVDGVLAMDQVARDLEVRLSGSGDRRGMYLKEHLI